MRLRSLTPLPGSGQARDTSGRRGLFSGCRKRRPGGRRCAAWGGEDQSTRELDSCTTRQRGGGGGGGGGCSRRAHCEGAARGLGHRLPHGTRFLRSSRHRSGIVRSAPRVAHSPAQGAAGGRGRGRGSAGRVQGGGGASAPGPPPRPITEPTGSWLPHAPHRTSEAASPLALDLGPHSSSRWTPSAPAPRVREPWL